VSRKTILDPPTFKKKLALTYIQHFHAKSDHLAKM